MLHAAPDALEDAWSFWFGALRQPIVLVCAATWGAPEHTLLEAIRAELRVLGAALVVTTPERSFCFRPDSDFEEPLPARLAQKSGRFVLHRRYGLPLGEPPLLTLTLLDERGAMRVQASTDSVDGVAAAVLSTLRSAGMNVRADERVLLSRREVVLSSLMAAFALPFAESCKPHEKAPLPSPSAGEAHRISRITTCP